MKHGLFRLLDFLEDKIKTREQNQLIGYSGNVGFSNGPHLHFMAYMQHLLDIESIKTKFKINDGNETKLLLEKETYTRNY